MITDKNVLASSLMIVNKNVLANAVFLIIINKNVLASKMNSVGVTGKAIINNLDIQLNNKFSFSFCIASNQAEPNIEEEKHSLHFFYHRQ